MIYFLYVLGIARGTGWQHIGAYVNLGAYYLVGIPMALVFGFVLHLGGKGLWLGFLLGSLVQCILLSVVASFTDWQQQVSVLLYVFLYYLIYFPPLVVCEKTKSKL